MMDDFENAKALVEVVLAELGDRGKAYASRMIELARAHIAGAVPAGELHESMDAIVNAARADLIAAGWRSQAAILAVASTILQSATRGLARM